jgi:predicted TIM-barrel fold metal-dependent hydrolase
VDDHVIEHPDVWQDRVPAKLREQAPRVVDLPDGAQQWCYEGIIAGTTGLSAVAGTDLRERCMDPPRFESMRPGCYDPKARLVDMDEDGVACELLFPNFAGFAGGRFLRSRDKELGLICLQAYNDFVIEEWFGAAPDRYIPMMILPVWDTDACVAEIDRCADQGFRAIAFPDNPAPLGLASFYGTEWDAVLSAAEAADLVLCMHFGSSGVTPAVAADAPNAAPTAVAGATLFGSMTDLVYSPVLHRHPRLKVAYSEGQIGWIPFALQRLDQVWEHYRYYKVEPSLNPDVRPSDLFRTHVWGCFIDDAVGLELRDKIGVDRILWESDYPHADSLFPKSRTVLEENLRDVPEDEARLIAGDNARALFRFP